MSNQNIAPRVVQTHAADSWGVATALSAAIDTRGYRFAVVIVNAGAVGASGTVDIEVQSSTSSGGVYAAVSGAAFTQIVAANDNSIYWGIVDLHKLAASPFVKIEAVVGTAACEFSTQVLLLGCQDDSTFGAVAATATNTATASFSV